ncbi:MAG: HdeD family acid-resistance protein [Polyangiales bacterium]
MFEQIRRNWWMLLVRGLAGIFFGIGAFIWPGLTLALLISLFGAYAIIDGIAGIYSAIRYRKEIDAWGAMLLSGIVGVLAGIVAWVMPGLTALSLVYLIGVWAIARGAFVIIGAIRLRKEIQDEWYLILSGGLSAATGLLLLFAPGAGALAMLWLIGSFAIVTGGLFCALAFRIRPHHRESGVPPQGMPA